MSDGFNDDAHIQRAAEVIVERHGAHAVARCDDEVVRFEALGDQRSKSVWLAIRAAAEVILREAPT